MRVGVLRLVLLAGFIIKFPAKKANIKKRTAKLIKINLRLFWGFAGVSFWIG